jgi:predicted exporter
VTLLQLGFLAIAGMELNILHAVGIVLVTGMGVDYAIFVVDAARARDGFDATMLGLVVCCLTTACTFGLLALSEHPALRALGATVGSGVLLSLLCAPLSLLVLGGSEAAIANETAGG